MDSSIIYKLGKYIDPEEKLRAAGKIADFMSSAEYRRMWRARCSRRVGRSIARNRNGNMYYMKYHYAINVDGIKRVVEADLRRKLARGAGSEERRVAPALEGRVRRLEFLFKRLAVHRRLWRRR